MGSYTWFTDQNISIQQRHSVTTEVLRHLIRGEPIIRCANQYGLYYLFFMNIINRITVLIAFLSSLVVARKPYLIQTLRLTLTLLRQAPVYFYYSVILYL